MLNNVKMDALAVLENFCGHRRFRRKWYCKDLDPTTNLPTGKKFERAVWEMLMKNYRGKKLPPTIGVRCTKASLTILACSKLLARHLARAV